MEQASKNQIGPRSNFPSKPGFIDSNEDKTCPETFFPNSKETSGGLKSRSGGRVTVSKGRRRAENLRKHGEQLLYQGKEGKGRQGH